MRMVQLGGEADLSRARETAMPQAVGEVRPIPLEFAALGTAGSNGFPIRWLGFNLRRARSVAISISVGLKGSPRLLVGRAGLADRDERLELTAGQLR